MTQSVNVESDWPCTVQNVEGMEKRMAPNAPNALPTEFSESTLLKILEYND